MGRGGGGFSNNDIKGRQTHVKGWGKNCRQNSNGGNIFPGGGAPSPWATGLHLASARGGSTNSSRRRFLGRNSPRGGGGGSSKNKSVEIFVPLTSNLWGFNPSI